VISLPNISELSIGEKIKHMRQAQGISQENIAHALKYSQTTISRIESGLADYDKEMITALKKYMEIETAPLLDYEVAAYRNRLLAWGELVADNRIVEAQAIKDELAVILHVPYEADMILFYTMVETRMLFIEGEYKLAHEKLLKYPTLPGDAGTETQYLYHYNYGFLYINVTREFKKALHHLRKAFDMRSGDIQRDLSLYTHLSSAYVNLCKPVRAIVHLEQAIREFGVQRTNPALIAMTLQLAYCYSLTGELKLAKKLATPIIEQLRGLDSPLYIHAASVLAKICILTGDLDESYEYSTRAYALLQAHSAPKKEYIQAYITVLATMALCLLELKRNAEFETVIETGKSIVEGNTTFTMLFDSIGHLATLRDPVSTDYLENVGIPLLTSASMVTRDFALWMCGKLEQHYNNRGLSKKTMAIAALSRDIYRDILWGGADID